MAQKTMIDFLINAMLPITLLISIMLAAHFLLLNKIGAVNLYRMWLIIPIGVVAHFLPSPLTTQGSQFDENIVRYVVQPTEKIQQQMSVEWLLYIWVVVAVSMFIYWLVSHIVFYRQLNLQPLVIDNKSLVYREISLPKNLKIYESDQAFSPMLLGLLRQKLVLPSDFKELYNQEQQQLILQHEICHFDRNDIYWNLLAFCFISLFWFHPLVWLAYFRFRRDQELSCDQLVLARKQLKSRVNYSKALLVVAETAPPTAFAQLSFKKYGDKEIMFERIKQIQVNKRASKLSVSLVAMLSIAAMSGLSYAGSIETPDKPKKHRVPPKIEKPAKPIKRVQPKYPLKAVVEKIEGAVLLKFDLKPDGSVTNVEVMSGEPAYVFDNEAKKALAQWQYEPSGKYYKNQLVQLDFRLDENSTFKNVNLIEKIKITQ